MHGDAKPNLAIVAIIPARFASTRLPGKALADIHGQTLVERVYERARSATTVGRVVVATDDERIATVVRGFGGEVVMTSPDHATGTDRLAEAARAIEAEVIVNVQGDEPMLDPAGIDAAVGALVDDPSLPMATLSVPVGSALEMLAPSVVKVVVDARGNALYFSRSPIPHVRLGVPGDPRRRRRGGGRPGARAQARRPLRVPARGAPALRVAPPSPLEEAEGLEQLRALHHGMRIRVVPMDGEGGVAVDTPEDLERVRALLAPEKGRTV